MATPNFNWPEISATQNQKEVTHSDGLNKIEDALSEILSVDFTAGDVTLTSAQYRENVIFQCVNLTVANETLTLPQIKRGLVRIENNDTVETLSVVRGATTLTIPPGQARIIYTDGTANGLFEAAGFNAFDVGMFSGGVPGATALLLKFVAVRPFSFDGTMSGSQGHLGVAATAQTDFALSKNGAAAFATVRFAPAGQVATFVSVTATSFVAGDRLEITAPGVPDATAADVSITLAGTRT